MVLIHCDDDDNMYMSNLIFWFTYTALSEKEIGANPGGTPKTFWLPV